MPEAQRMTALARANHVRLGFAQLKRDIHAGITTIPDALNAPCAQSYRLWDLMEAQKGWAMKRTAAAFHRLELHNLYVRIGRLTERQRGAIRRYFEADETI